MAAEMTNPIQNPQKDGLSQYRFIIGLMAIYFLATSAYLVVNILLMDVHAARGKETLVSTDSSQYLDFAQRFLKGNFSMDYIRDVPHRQPLYPFALAVATKIGNGNLIFPGRGQCSGDDSRDRVGLFRRPSLFRKSIRGSNVGVLCCRQSVYVANSRRTYPD